VTQLSVVQSAGTVVVLCERPLAFFDALAERIRSGAGRIRTMDGAYLLYAIIDLAIDAVSTAVAAVRDRVDEIEAAILAGDLQPAMLSSIAQLRALSAIIARTTDVLAHELDALFDADEKDEPNVLASVPSAFLKDARDHARMVAESARVRTEQLVSLVQLYAAVSGTRLNEVTKTLTIIATIFIPLTFIAGIYGMNFAVMPELTWRWGYAAVLGVMGVTASVMVVIFKRKRWL
jgi:magnesium transporter